MNETWTDEELELFGDCPGGVCPCTWLPDEDEDIDLGCRQDEMALYFQQEST